MKLVLTMILLVQNSVGFSALMCNAPTGMILYGGNETEESEQLTKSGNSLTPSLEKWVNDSLVYGIYPKEQYFQAQLRAYRFMKMSDKWSADASEELQQFYFVAESGNIGRLHEVEDFLGKGNWHEAQVMVNNIKPENNIEENYKKYYSAYLNMKQGKLSLKDSLHINDLIHGCSKRDGDVVYHARVLHRLLYNEYSTYFDECPSEIYSQKSKSLDDENKLILYPNPSTGEVWYKTTNETNDNIEIKVFGVNGILVHQEFTSNNKINFSFSSGTYIVSVQTSNENFIEKLIIIK